MIKTSAKGRAVPKKVGTAPIIREGTEFEFDIVGEMTPDHQMIVGKTRCRTLDGAIIEKPGPAFASTLSIWLKGVESKSAKAVDSKAEQSATENVTSLPVRNSITLDIERLGNEVYHDMWPEKSEEIAWWASSHRTRAIAELSKEEKERVLSGLQGKMKKAA